MKFKIIGINIETNVLELVSNNKRYFLKIPKEVNAFKTYTTGEIIKVS